MLFTFALKLRKMKRNSESLKDKIVGCMVGGAVGDALGYAVEFDSREQIIRRYGSRGITRYEIDPASGKALISDDTQMSLFTAAGCLLGITRGCCRGIMGALHYYCRYTYLNWLYTQTHRYRELPMHLEHGSTSDPRVDTWLMRVPQLYSRRAPGNTCLSALEEMKENREPVNDSCGCGGVMRTAPITLVYAGEGRRGGHEAAREAASAARLTHQHPMGYLPSAFLSYLLDAVLARDSHGKGVMEECVNEAMKNFEEYEMGDEREKNYADGLLHLMKEALAFAKSDYADQVGIAKLGEGWTGHEALAIAVFCALRHEDSFEDAVVAAVNHDGDSDSTGAVCGNIMGAFLGRRAIPSYYTASLELLDVIEEMAEDVSSGCPIGEYIPVTTAEQFRWEAAYMWDFYWEPKKQWLPRLRDGSFFRENGWDNPPVLE